ncbi:MAG: C1 family peptidase [Pirellulaceae bacterium]|nr:C1 family peptidase [Pirellulaceae bacterium]
MKRYWVGLTWFVRLGVVVGCVCSALDMVSFAQETQVEGVAVTQEAAAEPPVVTLGEYQFTIKHALACTPVTAQGSTGTCWSFSTNSFLESELIRQGYPATRLSEMYVVRHIYQDKALNYVLRQGKANFSEGALAHDYINAAARYGVMPYDVYSGKQSPGEPHNHGEMVALLTGMVESVVKLKRPSPKWQLAFAGILDTYLGKVSTEFEYNGQVHTSQSLAAQFNFDKDDYISLSSFQHHPFYEPFVLEIPDNYSNGQFLNVPIDELVATIDKALTMGYTVTWDGDVSERTFSASNGLAILPEAGREQALQTPGPEMSVTQEMRQDTFLSYETTDDHLMHLVGMAFDQNGTKYYMIKNSWGEIGPMGGQLMMSEAYVRLKTVSILLHKDVLQAD